MVMAQGIISYLKSNYGWYDAAEQKADYYKQVEDYYKQVEDYYNAGGNTNVEPVEDYRKQFEDYRKQFRAFKTLLNRKIKWRK